MTQKRMDPTIAQQELTDHPYFKYRGCAPDPDAPELAAGSAELEVGGRVVSVRLPVSAWDAPDVDGGEDQAARVFRERAAIEVCVSCPVMVQCLGYGSSVTRTGRLAEPRGILGGMRALERHKAFVEEHQTVPVVVEPEQVEQLRTPQKLAVLRALARFTDPYDVAAWAGMDLRTANWQRSILVGKLGLPRSVSRRQMLATAVGFGLIDAAMVVPDDGTVPAIPPPAKTPPPAAPGSAAVVQLAFDDLADRTGDALEAAA